MHSDYNTHEYSLTPCWSSLDFGFNGSGSPVYWLMKDVGICGERSIGNGFISPIAIFGQCKSPVILQMSREVDEVEEHAR